MRISKEYLQNEVALIVHHVEDALSGLKEKDLTYVKKSILDIGEVGERLTKKLSPRQQDAIEEVKESATWILNNCKFAKKSGPQLTPADRDEIKRRFGDDLECSFAKDDKGFYCKTHRARSKSYPSIAKVPRSVVDFIGSTG
jgi:hypothetical protein